MTHEPQTQADGYASDDLTERVHRVIADALEIDVEEVMPGCHLANDYGMTVFAWIQLRALLEKRFDLTIPRAEARKWTSPAEIVSYLRTRVQ